MAVPRLPQLAPFGPGPYQLYWLGQLKASEDVNAPTGLDMTAHFVGMDGAQHDHVRVDLPLTALPGLRLGMVWRNGAYADTAGGRVGTVTVDMRRFEHAKHAMADPYYLVPPSLLPMASVRLRCWCRLVPLADGSELIVPAFELLRSMYFMHSHFIPAFIGGAVEDPNAVSPSMMPWIPELTFRESRDIVQIGHPKRIGEDWAKVLAGVLFEPKAVHALRSISTRLREGRLSGRTFMFPPLVPPLAGKASWRIRYLSVPSYRGAPARRLVLEIERADHPLPYRQIRCKTPDNRTAALQEEDLELYRHRPARIVLPADGALDLYPSAPDSRLQKVDLQGLRFDSGALDVDVLVDTKETQTHRAGPAASGPAVAVDGIATDESGLPVPGRPGVAAAGMRARSDALAAEERDDIDMRRVFDEVRQKLVGLPTLGGWKVETLGRDGLVRVKHPKRGDARSFLVLHICHAYRHVYVLEAEKLNESDSFPVLTCQRPQGEAISHAELAQWLGNFPYERRWLDPSPEGLLLIPDVSIHQQRRQGMTVEDVHRHFVDRLTRHVEAFIKDPYWRHRRRRLAV